MSENDRTEEFLALYSSEQRKLYAYIRALIMNQSDAEEIFQEVCLVLWRSYGEFVQGTSFSAWSRQIARHRILAFFKKKKGEKLCFSEEAVSKVSEGFQQANETLESRTKALAYCIQKLKSEDRELINHRYQSDIPTVEIAKEHEQPLSTIYKRLSRIRKSLLACISSVLAREGLAPK